MWSVEHGHVDIYYDIGSEICLSDKCLWNVGGPEEIVECQRVIV